MDLKTRFFSSENVSYLQDRIQKLVFEKTKVRLAPQERVTMYITMNSIYDDQRFFLSTLDDLNQKVLEGLVPNLVSKVRMRDTYLRDRFQPRQIPNHPRFVSQRGEEYLEHGSFFK